ncbi:hypothetical protein [Neoroseomonas soli]|uniref:Copper chaperone PCu(A)C n=1 Tax=Neoroseomonas soli TaxID=1081025 RepID=A0A9X9WZ82_9PROT|nr:hypothetical protein [Neoroseomonas soli]MBR0672461.1 hypothetical protein [Neoroseomonas soli]
MNRRMLVLSLAALPLLPVTVRASNTRGPHGGHRTDIAGGHGELVAEGGELRLYLSDNAYRARSAEGASAQAVVLAAGKQTTVALAPAGAEMLRGQGDFTAAPGMRVVVSLTLPGQRPAQARFTPMDQN